MASETGRKELRPSHNRHSTLPTMQKGAIHGIAPFFVPTKLAEYRFSSPESEMDCRPFANLGFYPDPPLMPFNDLFDDRQARAAAPAIFITPVQSFKNGEHCFEVSFRDPDAVVADVKNRRRGEWGSGRGDGTLGRRGDLCSLSAHCSIS